jgi:hypothetical protein
MGTTARRLATMLLLAGCAAASRSATATRRRPDANVFAGEIVLLVSGSLGDRPLRVLVDTQPPSRCSR